MAKLNTYSTKDDGSMYEKPDILRAARMGDFDEGLAALKEDPDCINCLDSATKMNAVQIALSQGQEEFAIFLLSNTEVSATHKDALDRSAWDIVIQNLACSDEIITAVEAKWCEQMRKQDEREKISNVVPIKPDSSPKP